MFSLMELYRMFSISFEAYSKFLNYSKFHNSKFLTIANKQKKKTLNDL